MLINKIRETEVQDPFVPLAVVENAFRYWWLLVLLTTIGGVIGWFVSSFKPPLHEAVGQFSVAIDYVGTGPLTQYDEDLAINTAGHIFDADEVLQKVIDQAAAEGMELSWSSLRDKISLERRFSEWTFRVRDVDPQVAQRLAVIWMEHGQALLLESYQHAVQAYQLQLYIQSQEGCLNKAVANEPSANPCAGSRFSDIQENLREAGEALFAERQASRGLFAGVTIGPFNPPQVSPRSITPGRSTFVFLGGMLGLLLAIALIETGAVKTRRMKS